MSMNAGTAACTTGLAQFIYNYRVGDPSSGFSSPLSAAQTTALKHDCYEFALAIVTYIQGNATVNITVPADAFGSGIPATDVVLTGTVT